MVKETITSIEKDLKDNSNILLNNFNTFQHKYRGNRDLDVILYSEYDEDLKETFIKLYVADVNDRIFTTYKIKKGKLEKLNTKRKNGHKRIHYIHR